MRNRALLIAGISAAAIAILHVAIIVAGASAYRYFGAGERMAALAERHSLVPGATTAAIAVVFAIFALYAFSGAGIIRPLPLLRTALVAISTIFLLRGIAVAPQLIYLSQHGRPVLQRYVMFSTASLVTGLFYLIGTVLLIRERS